MVSVLKVELHAHTDQDPADFIPHTTRQLIDRAAELGYHALAVTLHDRYYDPAGDLPYARTRGITLIPGIEKTVQGRHLLLLNFPCACAGVRTFDDVRALKRRHPSGLVVAPHPFYPIATAMEPEIDRHADIIDALEVNAMFTAWLNFNHRAAAWAGAHGKPLVGNTDLHLLQQMGTTYSLVDAEPDADAICAAIRAGRVEVRSTALTLVTAAAIFGIATALGAVGRARRLVRRATAARQAPASPSQPSIETPPPVASSPPVPTRAAAPSTPASPASSSAPPTSTGA